MRYDLFQLIEYIRHHLNENASAVFVNQREIEPTLLKKIAFCPHMMRQVPRTPSGLFGEGNIVIDFVSSGTGFSAVIEVKRIGFETIEKGIIIPDRNNECDIKNGLAQAIEQAVAFKKSDSSLNTAILLLLCGGDSAQGEWGDTERRYISMFANNPFGINLYVLRARFTGDKGTPVLNLEVYPPQNTSSL